MNDGNWLDSYRNSEWTEIYFDKQEQVTIDVAPHSCFVDANGDAYAVCRRHVALSPITIFICAKCPLYMRNSIQQIVTRIESNSGEIRRGDLWDKKMLGAYPAVIKSTDSMSEQFVKAIAENAAANNQTVPPPYLQEILSHAYKPRKKIFGII